MHLATGLLAALVMTLAACRTGDAGVAAGPEAAVVPSATTVPPADGAAGPPTSTTVPEPVCTVSAQFGDSLISIAQRNSLTVEQLVAENLIDPNAIFHPGQLFDVCIGDRVDPDDPTLVAPPPAAVRRHQIELNELFSSTSMLPLVVDGDPGKLTRQAICAARMALGLPVHNRHLVPGSEEEAVIVDATSLAVPEGAPTSADRWILVDQTCQVIFIGEGDDRLIDVFPTSTGSEGHETLNVRARAFRFDPALETDGWHDSTSFPVAADNPLNGNMYKPIYFHDGLAIHGAEYVPPEPRSKGCARTFPKHQDMIIDWLGLTDRTEATWNVGEIDVTVAVQGRYADLPDGG